MNQTKTDMSKQTDAKLKQGYVPKLTPKACMNCASFRCENAVFKNTLGEEYHKDINLRCATGGFAVKKMGTCDEWKSNQLN